MKKVVLFALFYLFVLGGMSTHAADMLTETDPQLHADGGGKWGMVKATITDPSLPRVLLIGDSILMGYGARTIKILKGKANVDVWLNPLFQSEKLNRELAKVLKNGPYDVVHFNVGLHGWQEGRILPGTYEPQTKAYVQIIRDKMPKAKLIWANTTPFTIKGKPTELDPVINPIIIEHDQMAAKVMAEMKVPVNDFYGLLINKLELGRGDTVHWKPEAYPILAKEAADSILRELDMTSVVVEANATVVVETPEEFAERMAWWKDAKFGMFVHWGVYSQAGGEWNGETHHAEWLQLTAKIPLAEYTAYVRTFNPEKFNADEWVKIIKDAGMKYLVITSKHHDGFAMYDSQCNAHNIVKGSAFKRDPLKELAEACQKQGIRFCVYYSLGRDWQDPDVPTGSGSKVGWRSNLIDFPDEGKKDFSKYFERKVKPQVRELLTNYGPIGVMWFDTYELISKEQGKELLQLVRTLQPDCIVNNRVGPDLGDYTVSEQKIPSDASAKPWESCMTMNGKWSYNKADHNWKSSEMLLRNLIDIVSKGGNYLLNVGPTGEGIIPEPSVNRLMEMGQWLRVNGEAIYGCGPTPFGSEVGTYSETEKDKKGDPKFIPVWKWRATTRPGKLYIHIFEWSTETMELPTVKTKITKAYLLADPEQTELNVVQTEKGVSVSLPEKAQNPIATVVCLELAPGYACFN